MSPQILKTCEHCHHTFVSLEKQLPIYEAALKAFDEFENTQPTTFAFKKWCKLKLLIEQKGSASQKEIEAL
jgi:hypothetical protein